MAFEESERWLHVDDDLVVEAAKPEDVVTDGAYAVSIGEGGFPEGWWSVTRRSGRWCKGRCVCQLRGRASRGREAKCVPCRRRSRGRDHAVVLLIRLRVAWRCQGYPSFFHSACGERPIIDSVDPGRATSLRKWVAKPPGPPSNVGLPRVGSWGVQSDSVDVPRLLRAVSYYAT